MNSSLLLNHITVAIPQTLQNLTPCIIPNNKLNHPAKKNNNFYD